MTMQMIRSPVGGDIHGFKTKDNEIVRFDNSTGDFVIGDSNGTMTMFKPRYKSGRGLEYFNEQQAEHGG